MNIRASVIPVLVIGIQLNRSVLYVEIPVIAIFGSNLALLNSTAGIHQIVLVGSQMIVSYSFIIIVDKRLSRDIIS